MTENRNAHPDYGIQMEQEDSLINSLVKLEAISDLISDQDPSDARLPRGMGTLMWDLAREFRMAIESLPVRRSE